MFAAVPQWYADIAQAIAKAHRLRLTPQETDALIARRPRDGQVERHADASEYAATPLDSAPLKANRPASTPQNAPTFAVSAAPRRRNTAGKRLNARQSHIRGLR